MKTPSSSEGSGSQPKKYQSGKGGRVTLVLAIDDDQGVLEFYKTALSESPVRLESTTDPARGIEMVQELSPDLVLLDLTMPGMNGLEVLHRLKEFDVSTRVVMVTGNYSIDTAVEAIREGAADYVCKPIALDKLRSLVDQAREQVSRTARAEALEKELAEVSVVEGIIGRSPRMLEVFDLIQRVAPHFHTALILGETGTGKELVARALHNLGPRSRNRIAVCNSAALTESLVESQLFGHRKGAFTGATEDRLGLFEWADQGTVFLDEVGELSPAVQSKLLRVLENNEVQSLGSPQPRKVDVSVVAATSRDLNQEVKAGRFRSDLWYRLNMIQIQLPPLRERREDIPLLARHFVEEFSRKYDKEIRGTSRRAQTALLAHSWPGNVRELENVIGRACMLTRGKVLDLVDFPAEWSAPQGAATGGPATLEEAEKSALLDALSETKNKALAARILGISRATLYRLMEKYGIKDEGEPETSKD